MNILSDRHKMIKSILYKNTISITVIVIIICWRKNKKKKCKYLLSSNIFQ